MILIGNNKGLILQQAVFSNLFPILSNQYI